MFEGGWADALAIEQMWLLPNARVGDRTQDSDGGWSGAFAIGRTGHLENGPACDGGGGAAWKRRPPFLTLGAGDVPVLSLLQRRRVSENATKALKGPGK